MELECKFLVPESQLQLMHLMLGNWHAEVGGVTTIRSGNSESAPEVKFRECRVTVETELLNAAPPADQEWFANLDSL